MVFLQVAIFALIMGIAGTIFYYIGVSMGWLYVRLNCAGVTRWI